MYKKIVCIIALFGSFNLCFSQTKTMNTADNTLSQTEKSNGWKLLFDGQTTNGWHSYGAANARKAWTVNDGALYMDAEAKKNLASSEGGDLVTNEEYGNFDL